MAVIKKESHQTWIGTAAEMALFTSMLAGDKFITTDTKLEYEYTGAAWIIKSTGVQLSGSNITQDPKTGAKTVTSTAAELFAGVAALDGRNKLIVYNEGSGNVYWGKGTVTTITGFPLLPGDSIVFSFKPDVDTPIFFVAEADNLVRVGELA